MQIKLKNLKRDYGSLHAVDGVSLDIPSNTVYGIIGRSGAGKSTLVRLVSMLERPDEGEVWYGDKRVDNLSKKDLIEERRKIGMIFQNFNLFSSRTAAENIAYPMEICRKPKDWIKKRTEELLAWKAEVMLQSPPFPVDRNRESPLHVPLPVSLPSFSVMKPPAPWTLRLQEASSPL